MSFADNGKQSKNNNSIAHGANSVQKIDKHLSRPNPEIVDVISLNLVFEFQEF